MNEKLYDGGELREYVGVCCSGYENIHVSFGYGTRNTKWESICISHTICGLLTHALRREISMRTKVNAIQNDNLLTRMR